MLLKAQSVTKAFGPQKVLKDVSLQINEKDRIGLVGVNGAGKSTFLKILLGEERADTGEITRRTDRIGYMSQFSEISDDMIVREVLEESFPYVEKINRRMKEIDDLMASGGDIDWNGLAEESAQLQGNIDRFKLEILAQVNFPKEAVDRRVGTLSGGERSKLVMAKKAIEILDCDLLIMDEPTSHLDIGTIEWLRSASFRPDVP